MPSPEPNPKVIVPEHLRELVTPDPQNQEQNEQQSQEDPPKQQVELLTQMLEVQQAQSGHLEAMQAEIKQMREDRTSGRQYISDLEQRGPTPAGQQGVDYESMTQQELAQAMGQSRDASLQQMARQFGELLEVIAPQWDGWPMRDAIYGLMSQGVSPKQAYETVKKAAQSSAPAAQDPQKKTGQNGEELNAVVDERVKEILAQQRSNNAGISGRPARNDATAPSLTPRELHKQLHAKLVAGERIPEYAGHTPG